MTMSTHLEDDQTQPPQTTLTARTTSSVMWMTAQRWFSRLGALATLVVLTRLLAPEDFGLASAAVTLMPLLYVLADVGFSTYIVQVDELGKRSLGTAFAFALGCGVVLTATVVASAPLLAAMLDTPSVTPLIQVMAASVMVVAFSSVPISLLRRRMAFRSIAVMEMSSTLVAQAVAVVAAFSGAGAWALILQVLVSQVVYAICAWITARWVPNLRFSSPDFVAMARFGLPVVGSGLIGMARAWLETVIIIGSIGVREMGFIVIAQRLVYTAQDMSVSAVAPVATSAFARARTSAERLRAAYLRASTVTFVAVTPLLIFVAVTAPVLVPFFFGADKSPSAELVPALVAIILLNVGWAVDQGLYLGSGRPRPFFLLVAVTGVVSLSALALGAQFGLQVMLGVWILMCALETVARWVVVRSVLGVGLWQAAKPVIGLVLPSAVTVAAGVGVLALTDGAHELARLVLVGLAMLVVYVVATRALRPRAYAELLSVLPGRLRSLVAWSTPGRFRENPLEEDADARP